MRAFEDITLDWNGKAHVIPANRVLGAIARIEDVITMHELQTYAQSGTLPMAKLAQAFGAALRYAGARVTDDDVYAGMFADASEVTTVHAACDTLLAMMVPPGVIDEAEADEAGEDGNEAPGKSTGKSSTKGTGTAKKTAKARSRNSTRRRSGKTAG